ncbi:hypothetical protein R1sor_021523 [Riccia sorocarpa]|uniref:F-box domain-containing protein n=1 Tax=Riccia sorocarpa TaxID=122646 RepID=A0ABD3GJ61_9MARC
MGEIFVKCPELTRPDWSQIDDGAFHSIMLKLEEVSVIRSSVVCKRWNFMITSETFTQFYSKQWVIPFSVKGSRYFFQAKNAAGQYNDMQPFGSFEVPYLFAGGGDTPCQEGAGGLFYFFTGTVLHYKLSLVQRKWFVTPQMIFTRRKPIVGVLRTRIDGAHKVVVAGGIPDLKNDQPLSVEIYDSTKGMWEVRSSLPLSFGVNTSFINPAVYDGKFYVFHRRGAGGPFCSILDLKNDAWSLHRIATPVHTYLKPMYLVENSSGLSLVIVDSFLHRDSSTMISMVDEQLIMDLVDGPSSCCRVFCFEAWDVNPGSLMLTKRTHHSIASVNSPYPPTRIVSIILVLLCAALFTLNLCGFIFFFVMGDGLWGGYALSNHESD